jgi:Lrp/AsnC family transcriptional regulator, leucine-responsive regulatory protein
MDIIDRRIIAALEVDARQTLQDLADRVGLSPSATRERVRRLEARGAIVAYRAVLGSRVLGFTLSAVVEVDLPPGADPAAFEDGLRAEPAVVEALHATGPRDYLLRLLCADADELHAVARAIKRDLGAVRTETSVILDTPISFRGRVPGSEGRENRTGGGSRATMGRPSTT